MPTQKTRDKPIRD